MSSNPGDSTAPPGGGGFRTTHWSVVLLAGQPGDARADEALERLCRAYWPPLYAYVRRLGHGAHDAQDLTQEFFARLLEKNHLQLADRDRGRFRSFLLKSMKHFLVNEWVRGQALKRGGGQKVFSIDEAAERLYLQQPADQGEAEHLFDRRWALTLLERAMDRLGADYATAGKPDLFQRLKPFLLAEGSGDAYRQVAGPLALSEGAVKVAVHRLRQRFRDVVRDEIAQTVADPADVDEELRLLMAALTR